MIRAEAQTHAPDARATDTPAPPPQAPAPPSSGAEQAAPAAPGADPGGLVSLWARIARNDKHSPVLRALLTNASLASLDDAKAVIACAPRFAEGLKPRLGAVADLLERELNRRVEVEIQAIDDPAAASQDQQPEGAPAELPGEHPLVREAIKLFNARIVSVQPRAPQ